MWTLDSPIDPFLIYNFKILEIDDLILPPFSCLYFTDNFLSLTSFPMCFWYPRISSYSWLIVFKVSILFEEVHILVFIVQCVDNQDSSNSCPSLTADFRITLSSQAQGCNRGVRNSHHRPDGNIGQQVANSRRTKGKKQLFNCFGYKVILLFLDCFLISVHILFQFCFCLNFSSD